MSEHPMSITISSDSTTIETLRKALKNEFKTMAFYSIDHCITGVPLYATRRAPRAGTTSDVGSYFINAETGEVEHEESNIMSSTHYDQADYVDTYDSIICENEEYSVILDGHEPSDPEVTRQVEIDYDQYIVTTAYRQLEGPRRVSAKEWRLESSRRVDFVLGRNAKRIYVPSKSRTPPEVSDIVCIILDPENVNRSSERPNWFVASPQFLRFWRLVVVGPDHPAFRKNQNDIRRFMNRSVTLATNGYRKWTRGWVDHGLVPSIDEQFDRFYHTQHEWAATAHCHIYLVLANYLLFHELPSADTLPSGGKIVPPLLVWDFPEHLFTNLYKYFDILAFDLEEHAVTARAIDVNENWV